MVLGSKIQFMDKFHVELVKESSEVQANRKYIFVIYQISKVIRGSHCRHNNITTKKKS